MPFNGSGTFTRLFNWVNDAAASINITASRMDSETDGIATGLSNCITRDGQGKPSAAIDWNGQNLSNVAQLVNTGVAALATGGGGIVIGGPVAAAIDQITLASATLGTGIAFGAIAGNYANLWTPFSSSGWVVASGLKADTASDAYQSSYGASIGRNAMRFDFNGGIKFFVDSASVVVRGTAIVPTLRAQIQTTGLTVVSGTIGYGTGAGGAITQLTNKATGVTLNTGAGQITMNGAALGAATVVSFTFTNSQIAATDVVAFSIASAATAGAYAVIADSMSAGSCRVSVKNISAGSLSEAIVLNFAVIKAVAA